MTPRRTRQEFERGKGSGNRRALRRLVAHGTIPGLIAYRGQEPVGWCSIEPREAFPLLARSRVLKPVDDQPVWSIVCLFVAREQRRTGISRALIEAAVRHARRHGARVVEAYPIEPKKTSFPDAFAYTGIASAYRRAGFAEVARRSPTRPIMRRVI
ncbi:MAG: GNAT family N-acetyltransferase [Planctomycetes bacterium]|nr:GNAT family N-acetyltransferase [Planctomycetota bacterium]